MQAINKTPASLHGEALPNMTKNLEDRLRSYQVPFIRTAYNGGDQDNSSIYKKVIPKEYAKIEELNNAIGINTYSHYFAHPNEINTSIQRKILQFFNDGVGKNQ